MQNIKEFKKTNIPWMGEIPKHWEVRRLKSLYDFDKGQGLSKLDISNEGIHECLLYGELFTRFKGYNVIDDNFQKTNIQERKISKGNELLIPGSTTTTSVDLCNCKALKKSGILLGGDIIILRPLKKKILNEFYSYFISSICKTEFVMYGRGVTIHHIYPNQIGNMKVLLPPLSEQKTIANYLDRQNKKINHFIEKRQRFIELLKEQRQTIINKAVTKGHRKRLKYIVTVNDESLSEKTNKDYLLKYIDIGNVKSDGSIAELQNLLFKDAPSRARRIVNRGDVIISTVRTYLQAITLINSDEDNLIVSTGFAVLRPIKGINSEYLNYVLRGDEFIENVIKNSFGINYPAINSTTLSALAVNIVLNEEEQHQIASYIKTETTKIDQAIEKSEREILLIKEYKESMIAEAVLGKLVVSC